MSAFFVNSDLYPPYSSASIKKQRIDKHNFCVKIEHQDEAEVVAPGVSSIASAPVIKPAVSAKKEHEEERPIYAKKRTATGINNVQMKKEINVASSNRLHVVFFGPVLGQFKTFAHFLKKWEDKVSSDRNAILDACFCVGPFFHNDIDLEGQAKELISGGYALPCPVYFVDEGNLPKPVTQEVLQSLDSAHFQDLNLHYLSASDGVGDIVSLLDNRLSVAFTSPNFTFHPNTILERKCKDPDYKGCDVLITSEWGKGINSILDITRYFQDPKVLDEGPDSFFRKLLAQERFDVAKVALLVQPHYHIAPSTASLGYCYFHTPCFTSGVSSSSPINHYCKGFRSLSCCGPNTEKGNNGKDKYSFMISPNDNAIQVGGELKPQNNPYGTYALYLESLSVTRITRKRSNDSDDSQFAAGIFDKDSVSLFRQERATKGFSNRDTFKNYGNFSTKCHLEQFSMTGSSLQIDVTDPNRNKTILQDSSDSKFSNGSSTTNNSVQQWQTVPGLYTDIHYDRTLYDEPVLHKLIINGLYEEAISHIRCQKKLKRKVKDDNGDNNSTSNTILEVESFNEFGFLPIHILLNYTNHTKYIGGQKRLELLKLLLDELPEGARTKSLSSFELPLSFACQTSIHVKGISYFLSIDVFDEMIIKNIANLYPTATKLIYEKGRSILHFLLQHRPSLDLVEFIVDKSDSADYASKDKGFIINSSILEYCDEEKQAPIHTAIQYYAPCDVIKFLIHKFPLGVQKKMLKGFLPLHCAARWGCSESVMTSLLESFPEAVLKRNSDGLTPFELIFSYTEIWMPNFEVPDIACDDEIRALIISREDERQIPPRHLMAPFEMVVSMVEAYRKVQGGKRLKGKKSNFNLLAVLKAKTGRLWKNVGILREKLRLSKRCSRELDQAVAYLRSIVDKGAAPLQMKSE